MRRSIRRSVVWLASLLLLIAAGGCTALADEFVWLDKAAPDAHPRGDAGQDGTASRP